MFIDIHILQSVPPSNINRDDTGSPKTAVYGGTRRARVSSQSWKRATRKHFNSTLDRSEIGYRTRKLAELLAGRIIERAPSFDDASAEALASSVFKDGGIKMATPKARKDAPKQPDESGYLVFLSSGQLDALAELALATESGQKLDAKEIKRIIKSDHSVDVALFGRMIADEAELNVDAAVQVAHAISVQAVEQEFDYFTAVDDFQESQQETGAGMIGTVEFNSSTLYRYATINASALKRNLGDTATAATAAATFVKSFARSMPTGKANTFANNTLPDLVLVCVRSDQPVSLVGAFEDAVVPTVDSGAVALGTARLFEREAEIAAAYGEPLEKIVTAVGGTLAEGMDKVPLDKLVERVRAVVAAEPDA